MPSVNSDTSDRIPLHASATSNVAWGRTMTLPSRSTGIEAACSAVSPKRDASSCSGNAIWLKMNPNFPQAEDAKRVLATIKG